MEISGFLLIFTVKIAFYGNFNPSYLTPCSLAPGLCRLDKINSWSIHDEIAISEVICYYTFDCRG